VLLVDDDQPELGKRQEQRGTGADDDLRLAATASPGVMALGRPVSECHCAGRTPKRWRKR
jgi:hypothetical protein